VKGLRFNLQLRFLLGVAIAAASFALLAGVFAYGLGQRRAEESARATVVSLQAAVEKTAAIAVYAHDAQLMHEVVEGVARNALVRRADILGPHGVPLMADSPVDGAGDPALTVHQRLQSPFDAAETIGSLRIEIDAEQLSHLARREAWTLALLMVAQSALIALVIYLTGARLVSRPIVRLARELAAMPPGAPGTLSRPAGHDRDEIGALVRSANELLDANAQAFQRERELRRDIEAMEQQYRQIFDSSSAGIFVLDREGRLINGNPTVLKLIGGDAGNARSDRIESMRQLRGQDFLGRVFARPERVRAMIDEAARRNETVSADLELHSADGEIRWAHCLVSVQDVQLAAQDGDAAAPRAGIVEGVLYDITERKRVEHDVRRRAERDMLTGALNRAATDEAIDDFLATAGPGQSMTLLYLDLDGFKQVNDRLGHACGDQVLQEATRRITGELRRASDLVGRIGGDEFVVVLQHGDAAGAVAAQIAAHIVERLCEPFALDGGASAALGVSIGLASYPRHGSRRRDLMHAADAAMYAVKRHGKNAYASACLGWGASNAAADDVDIRTPAA
jgi:diguanylate cyclase (GGDEF)-like protein/PAS domain S-box-containing protein